MNTSQRASKIVEEFVRDLGQHIMVLKGPWGVGKSYFVRGFLEKQRKTAGMLPPYLSYASIFGLRTVQEVQSMINRCIDHTAPSRLSRAVKTARDIAGDPVTKAVANKVDIAALGDSAYWQLAKRNGLFIVIDDVERAPNLDMEQLLGLASSITETGQTKVLLVLNLDKLSKRSTSVFTQYREKVVDVELLFNPNTSEIVAEYLDDKLLTETVVTCLNASEGANIRLIQRINRAIRHFREAARDHRIPFERDDLKHIAKLVWLYHVSPLMPDSETVWASWGKRLFGKQEKEEISPEEQQLDKYRSAVSYRTNTFDGLILSYLRTGYFSEQSLIEQAQSETRTAEQLAYDRRVEQVFEPYHKNFHATKEQMIAGVEGILKEYPQRIGMRDLRQFCGFLEELGHDTAKWWQQFVPKIADKLNPRERRDFLGLITDHVARRALAQQIAGDNNEFDPKATIRNIVDKHGWDPDQMEALDALPAEFYREWFNSETGELLGTIREFLTMCSSMPPAKVEGRLGAKILGVLKGMAEGNELIRLQLRDVFSINLRP